MEGLKFRVATAASRTQKVWKNISMSWKDIINKIENPIRTNETVAEYRAMSKADRDIKKDVGGFVGGYLKDGIRKKGHLEARQLVCLDADNIPSGVDFPGIVKEKMKLMGTYALYSTHSHTPGKPRFRLVIPLMREVTAEEYEPLARFIANDIGIDMFDPTTYQDIRLMYWPSVSSDGEYISDHAEPLKADGSGLHLYSPDVRFTCNPNWQDATTWPTASTEAAAHKKVAKKLGDPREKPGLIGLFCQAYTVEEAMETFLPEVYTRVDGCENRWTFAGGSTTGGVIVYDEGLHVYSHHATDPISGQDVNAFDLVRLNLFGIKDEDTEPTVPVNKRPSYVAMTDLCQKDKRVQALRNKEIADQMRDDLLEEGEELDLDWMSKLERMKNTGKIVSNAKNLLLIMANDPRLKDRIGLELFASRIAVLGDLPWRRHTKEGAADIWTDADDSQLRNFISTSYEGLTGKQVIDDAFTEVTQKNAFHPVRDWLESLAWDGVPRVRRLLIDYLGADDTAYTEEITEKFFKAAVARVYRPGTKFDFCLTISGPQGIGKSTLLALMGGRWFNDTVTSIHGKDAMEQLQGYWLVELGEMQAATKAENNELKAFISRQNDKYRAPYGRRTEEHPRQCVFAATTNERIFLKDRTGGRRFWIVMCSGNGQKNITEFTKEEAAQCWAEVLELYRKDKKLLPSKEVLDTAKELQEAHTEGAEKLGLIQNYLDTDLPDGWDNMPLNERQAWLEGDHSINGPGINRRERVCAMEIWCECFGNLPKNLKNIDAREINNMMQLLPEWKPHESKGGLLRFKLYGRQRAYIRKSTDETQNSVNKGVNNYELSVNNSETVDIEDLM
ncbi:Virulence-associated protein E [Anaerovibrio lipolyticus DSM 3074]|uniref:Virulence-associated protein E n=2 Tax=Anaerovibrio lipolyticus TaxID=82374 RepID=A0A1M6DZH1_9FIRM|nr:Virulence-associated protein E [Anaerovibrio lipolyticus DSM 3074]